MKKIECLVADDFMESIDEVCNSRGYTRAEFTRRALEFYEKQVREEFQIQSKLTKK